MDRAGAWGRWIMNVRGYFSIVLYYCIVSYRNWIVIHTLLCTCLFFGFYIYKLLLHALRCLRIYRMCFIFLYLSMNVSVPCLLSHISISSHSIPHPIISLISSRVVFSTLNFIFGVYHPALFFVLHHYMFHLIFPYRSLPFCFIFILSVLSF